MTQIIKTIKREAGDTSKGYTLQKLRTISLILSEIQKNETVDFTAAIEYNGDIYLNTQRNVYVEENKAYESKDFSFASDQVKNTLVYFIDYWLNNKRDGKIKFGFYSTNDIAKESNAGRVKELGLTLPDKKIIDLLIDKDYKANKLIYITKTIILDEYKSQYENNRSYKLEESYYSTIEKFSDSDWIAFYNIIEWKFNENDIEKLENAVLSQIIEIKFPTIPTISGKERFIMAELFYELEIRQTKSITAERFIDKQFIELTFHRVINNGINDESYKFLFLDYNDLFAKTRIYLKQSLRDKYFAITGLRKDTFFLPRKVALFDASIKVHPKRTEFYDQTGEYTIEGNFDVLVNSDKPVFLFGELGSGKSTIVMQYLLSIIEKNNGEVPIFIPSSYLQNKELSTLENIINEINGFVNNELPLTDKFFDLNIVLKTEKEVLLIIDGLDELPIVQAKTLLSNIKRLKESNSKIRVIVTGRPVELEGILPSGWTCLVNIPLNDNEIKEILCKESRNHEILEQDCKTDSETRFNYLKSRNELYSIAKTPLVLCSIWQDLNESIENKTLGDLLYQVLKRRLSWHSEDQKGMDTSNFFKAYPNIYQREELLRSLVSELYLSKEKSLSDDKISQILNQSIGDIVNKNQVVAEAIYFFKNTFLQKTTNERYGFISAPLLECAYGLSIYQNLKEGIEKLDFTKNWRSISFAMAIARIKEDSRKVEGSLKIILEQNLSWSNNNVAQVAIILAELKENALADWFMDKISKLEFRPFRTLELNDHLTTYSLAYCLHLSGENGFTWFYGEYISCRIPLIHYQAKLVSDILEHYFIIKKFDIPVSQKTELSSIVKPNIAYSTSLCYELLPCLSLIIADEFSVDQRCLLLADLLNHESVNIKAKELLREIYVQNPESVLNAIETICSKRESVLTVATLWFELNTNRSISTSVLFNCIKSITPQNFEEIYSLLKKHIPEPNLLSFLRFCVISANEIAGPASLVLLWNDGKDFIFLSDAIINSIDWLDKKNYLKIEEIVSFINSGKDSVLAVLIENMPVSNHLGIPPAYWRLFISALIETDKEYPNEFMKAVDGLNKFILTRYPDIRIAFRRLFSEKPIYQDILKESMSGLNTGLKIKSAAILVVCFPETEFLALEKNILGFVYSLHDTEWQSFCLGLNYSKRVLDYLHSSLTKFTEGAKTYALALLYHHKYKLTQGQIDNLITGLLGEGYFFDNPGIKISGSPSGILSQSTNYEKMVDSLLVEDLAISTKASSILKQYHFEKLDLKLKAIVWLLQIESYERNIFDFALNHIELFSQADFVNSMIGFSESFIKAKKKQPLLYVLLKIEKGELNWKDLILRFIEKSERFDKDILHELFQFLLSFCRKYPQNREKISANLKDILQIPAYKENNRNNDIYPILSLIASEFEAIESDKLLPVLTNYRVSLSTEEVFCALAIRNHCNIESVNISYLQKNYVILFTPYTPLFFEQITQKEIESILVESEDIPDDFIVKTTDILLKGVLLADDLIKISEKGNLASYFTILISFCRKDQIQIEKLLKARKIGGTKYYQIAKTSAYRHTLRKIYRSVLGEEENRKNYIEALKSELNNPNSDNFPEYFYELIRAGEFIDFEHFIKLLGLFLKRPYLLKEDYCYELCLYLGNKLEEQNNQLLLLEIDKTLDAMNNHYDKDGYDGQYNLMMWLFSLASIYLNKNVNETARTSFLLGLRYIFLEKNSLERNLRNPPEFFFKAEDLYRCTYPLYSKIDIKFIKEILEYGLTCNVPEVSACCRTLAALAKHDN